MHKILLILLVVIIATIIIFRRKEHYLPFSAHFYPTSNNLEHSYEQMSRLPFNLPPVGPYSLGWDSQEKLRKKYPTQTEIYKLLHPS